MSPRYDTPVILEGLVLHPGDKLLVRVSPGTNPDQMQELLGTLKSLLPEVDVMVITAEQIAKATP